MTTFLADDVKEIGRLMRARANGEDVDAPFMPQKYRYGAKTPEPAASIPAAEDFEAIRQGVSAIKSPTYSVPPPLPAGTPEPKANAAIATDFVAIGAELKQRLVQLPMSDFHRSTVTPPVVSSFLPVIQGAGVSLAQPVIIDVRPGGVPHDDDPLPPDWLK